MTISQREARRLKKRVEELEMREERRRRSWANDYPGGTHIITLEKATIDLLWAIHTARKLQHAVVAVEDCGVVRFYALPAAKVHTND